MSVVQFCCSTTCLYYNPWIRGMSNDGSTEGYECTTMENRVKIQMGTDFNLTTYAEFGDGSPGSDPCEFLGISPYNFEEDVAAVCDCTRFPEYYDECCCFVNSYCDGVMQGGLMCNWYGMVDYFPGQYYVYYNLLCTKCGMSFASQAVEETSWSDCCGDDIWSPNIQSCGSDACSCMTEYVGTTQCGDDAGCNQTQYSMELGENCYYQDPTDTCNPSVYSTHSENVLVSYLGFDEAVAEGGLDPDDPRGDWENAVTFVSENGDTFEGRILLHDHIVDATRDITDYPGILTAYLLTFGSPHVPNTDSFPVGPYSPQGGGGGYMPWVTITLTMTSGTYNGITYTYNGYGTCEHFAQYAMSNWTPCLQKIVTITGSSKFWLGLRVPPDALDTTTGEYDPHYEYRRIVTRSEPLGYMPDNSDEIELDSTTTTEITWNGRLRHFYNWRVKTDMVDMRVYGKTGTGVGAGKRSCYNPASPTSCQPDDCTHEHCQKSVSMYGYPICGYADYYTEDDSGVCAYEDCPDDCVSCECPCNCYSVHSAGSGYTIHDESCDYSLCSSGVNGGWVWGYTDSSFVVSQYDVPIFGAEAVSLGTSFVKINEEATFNSLYGCVHL